MKHKKLLLLLSLFANSLAWSGDPIALTNLRCEYLVSPLGIDEAHPRLSWQTVNMQQQSAYQILLAIDSLAILEEASLYWLSPKTIGQDILVNYSGDRLQPFTKYYWAVKVWDEKGNRFKSAVTSFETGMVTTGNWKGLWISDGRDLSEQRSSTFLKKINIPKKILKARAYVAAGGLFELNLNGNKAGTERLNPMFTRYDRRILYVTHDITPLLHEGENVLSLTLGNGWFNHQPTAVWFFHEAPWRARPKFCLDIKLSYEDGSEETISTDEKWRYYFNDITRNNIYTGEFHDASSLQHSWKSTTVPDTALKPVFVVSAPSQKISSQTLHPIRDVDTLSAASVKQLDSRTYIYDLGKNISGVAEFKTSGPKGTRIRLSYAERLDSAGKADLSNIDYHYRPKTGSDPFQVDEFILSGNGEDMFRALFNYKGFQYVQVTCDAPLALKKENLRAFFMHSDIPKAGEISSSSAVLNKIWQATNNSYLANLFGYPTDCPQREKNGWTGDAHIALETGLYNFDGITIYEKWIADHIDAQLPNGVLPAIIPTADWGYNWANGPDWTSTIAIIPWNIYLFYGDKNLLAKAYPAIQKYVDHIADISESGLTEWGLGDWIPIKSVANKQFTTSIYFYIDAHILARAAAILGKRVDFEKYSRLSAKIKTAINDKFLNKETGIYASGFQTELSMPLYWGIVPDDLRTKVASQLAQRVENDGKLDVGLLGSKAILNALSENGYADIAYRLASNETYPSWGWWIKNGATTLFENWRIDASKDISMNHIMFGEISAWYYKCLGGIHPDESNPGFRHTILQPHFVKGLDRFEAKHQSPYGWITSKWKKEKGNIVYEAEIPSNSTATLYLPSEGTGAAKEITLAPGKHLFTLKQAK